MGSDVVVVLEDSLEKAHLHKLIDFGVLSQRSVRDPPKFLSLAARLFDCGGFEALLRLQDLALLLRRQRRRKQFRSKAARQSAQVVVAQATETNSGSRENRCFEIALLLSDIHAPVCLVGVLPRRLKLESRLSRND